MCVLCFCQVAGSLILDLNEEGTAASPVESDDRRHCLQIVSPVIKKYANL